MKNVANRAHAVNFNFGYDLPDGSKLWSNGFTKAVLDGWHFNGNGAIYSGNPYTVTLHAPTGRHRNTGPARPPPTFRSAARWGAICSFPPGNTPRRRRIRGCRFP